MKIYYYRDAIISFYNETMTTMLNKLEYICMNFNTGLADEDVVYNSLHQLFIITVNMLFLLFAI